MTNIAVYSAICLTSLVLWRLVRSFFVSTPLSKVPGPPGASPIVGKSASPVNAFQCPHYCWKRPFATNIWWRCMEFSRTSFPLRWCCESERALKCTWYTAIWFIRAHPLFAIRKSNYTSLTRLHWTISSWKAMSPLSRIPWYYRGCSSGSPSLLPITNLIFRLVPVVWGPSFSGLPGLFTHCWSWRLRRWYISGEHHKKQRKMLNPVFSIQHIRGLVPVLYPIAYEVRTFREFTKIPFVMFISIRRGYSFEMYSRRRLTQVKTS